MNSRRSTILVAALSILIGGGLTAALSTYAKPVEPGNLPIAGQQTPPTSSGAPAVPDAAVGTGFTYQGNLNMSGSPVNGSVDLIFKLYDALSGGTQVGSTITVLSQTVTNGLYTVSLSFGASAFQGQERWLQIEVQLTGGGGYTILSPRQPVAAVPYAMSLMPGAIITGTTSSPLLKVDNTAGSGIAVSASATNGYGVYATSVDNKGVFGESETNQGVRGNSNSQTEAAIFGLNSGRGPGVYGQNDNPSSTGDSPGVLGRASLTTTIAVKGEHSGSGRAVVGQSTSGDGVYGISLNGPGVGVRGVSSGSGGAVLGANTGSGYGVNGTSVTGPAVLGLSGSGVAVRGVTTSNVNAAIVGSNSGVAPGVYGFNDNPSSTGESPGVLGRASLTTTIGVKGENSGSGRAVVGVSVSGDGVYGQGGANGKGVYGYASGSSSMGVFGETGTGSGVYGNATSGGNGLYGASAGGNAIYSAGPAQVAGDLSVTGNISKGGGSFKIDHPLDPTNQYLYHSFVESPDMMNVYNGNVTTDAKGEATVTLPTYFETINRDFRYQLTIMGEQFAQARVSSKVKNNRFTIMTDKPNIEVSWQVTGIRQDPYANEHRIPVEENKPADEKGYYLHPDAYGQPDSMSVDKYVRERQSNAGNASAPPLGRR